MKAREFITETARHLEEKWSQKYKSSINCSHPKGFSQKAHCAGKKKHNESIEMEMTCPDCGMCQTHGDHMMETAERLDAKCWSGMHKEGTKIKGGVRVNNCVPNESIEESKEKRCMQCGMKNCKCPGDSCKCKPIAGWIPGKGFRKAMDEAANAAQQAAIAINMKKHHQKPKSTSEAICSLEEAHAIFDDFEQAMAARGLTEDAYDTITDEDIIRETAAWRRSAGKSKKGGLNAKGVASYRREHPGSKLQMAVTTKPSKLKPGSKAAKRRKSFCARMSGVKGPMKKPNGKPTRKALALRKWNC